MFLWQQMALANPRSCCTPSPCHLCMVRLSTSIIPACPFPDTAGWMWWPRRSPLSVTIAVRPGRSHSGEQTSPWHAAVLKSPLEAKG
ncbi:hypothetical protein CIB84_008086 [Bambusicola thoracicus]|uniref:Uncharacterized protein n=1 Tax=Bambusicola thoracicus TaxID=9083 RepID=A0A2P4SVM1_BAMTH|nr:hypothetical protein CIB84_008086 [Bambusicola thoracicus]